MQQPSEPAPRLTNEQQLEFTAWLGARYPGAEDDAQQSFVEELSQPQSVGALVRRLPGPFRAHLVASLAVETEAELVQTLVESAARTLSLQGLVPVGLASWLTMMLFSTLASLALLWRAR